MSATMAVSRIMGGGGLVFAALGARAALPVAVEAQVVQASSGAMVAYPTADANNAFMKKVQWGRDPSPLLALYAGVFRGSPGQLDSLSVDTVTQAFPVHFPTLHFIVSAASRVQSEMGEQRVGTHLRRLNAHVRLTPLDSMRQPIIDGGAVEVLEIQPNSIQPAIVAPADTASATGPHKPTVLSVLTRAYAPGALEALGARATAVAAHFRHSGLALTAPTQVSYLSGATEFGWTWYEHPDKTIEGIHRSAALLQAAPEVRYVKVQIDLITDWRYHGTWMKPFEAIVDLGRTRAR